MMRISSASDPVQRAAFALIWILPPLSKEEFIYETPVLVL